MGNKIITEKDFWTCTGGLVPAPMQTTQLSTKKVGDFKYITVKDTATVSFIDFSCKKLMFAMAMLAVAIALVTVATGGMALIAICAAAAAGGAIFGAVLGALLCGQMAAAARYWMQSKSNLIIQGQQAITGDHKMQCMIFGDIISFAPQIKNWWQAIALGTSNFIGEVLKNMMYGAAIGCGAAIVSGGPAVLSQFGLSNIGANWLATWGGYGLGLRGLMGAQTMLGAYGNTGTITGGDVVNSAFAMEIGTYHAASNILSGRGTVDDFLGVAMWMMPAPKNNRAVTEEARPNEQNRSRNEEVREEESAQARVTETEAPARQGEFDAFESPLVRMNRIQSEPFSRNPNHDAVEFQRQLEGQQDGLNNLTIDEFLRNRDSYLENGRSSEGSRAQERFREQALQDRIDANIERGLSPTEARAEAESWMGDQAALHDPDQIAGGHGDNVTGMGDRRVNSSLGSQWKTRIGAIDRQVREAAEGMTQEQRENTYLNIELPHN